MVYRGPDRSFEIRVLYLFIYFFQIYYESVLSLERAQFRTMIERNVLCRRLSRGT